MELSKKQIVIADEIFRKALNARGIDLEDAMKRCAKWWGISRKDEDYLDAFEGNNKARINYIMSFDMNDGEDFKGNYSFLKSLIKARIIDEPRGIEKLEPEDEEEQSHRRANTRDSRKDRPVRHKMTAEDGSELRPPKDVSDAEIKKALKQYGTINGAAKALKTRWSTINRRFDPEVIDELCGYKR